MKMKLKDKIIQLTLLLFLVTNVNAQPNSTHWSSINATQDTWVGVEWVGINITNNNYTYDGTLNMHRYNLGYPSDNVTSFAYVSFNVPLYMHDVYFTTYLYAHNVNTIHDIYVSIWQINDISNFTFTWNTQPCNTYGASDFDCGATLLTNYSMVGVGVSGVENTRQNISIANYSENLDGNISFLIGISHKDFWNNNTHQLLSMQSIESTYRPLLWYQFMNCTIDTECNEGYFCNMDGHCAEYNIGITTEYIIYRNVSEDSRYVEVTPDWSGVSETETHHLFYKDDVLEYNASAIVTGWIDYVIVEGETYSYQLVAELNGGIVGKSPVDTILISQDTALNLSEGAVNLTVNVFDYETSPLHNVKVTITSLQTGKYRTGYTNESGNVRFQYISEGCEYEIVASKTGYTTVLHSVLIYSQDENVNIYMLQAIGNALFNFTLYDTSTYLPIDNVQLEFVDYGLDILNYPNGTYILLATEFTNASGDFVGNVSDTPNCFTIGFKKYGYHPPERVNRMDICRDETMYDNDTGFYTIPYFEYYMIPISADVNVDVIVRDATTYQRLSNATVTVIDAMGALHNSTTATNGTVGVSDGTGCWSFTINRIDYITFSTTGCYWSFGNFTYNVYLLRDITVSDWNITFYNVTGYVIGNDSILIPFADVSILCNIETPSHAKIWKDTDIARTNSTGYYQFLNFARHSSECTILASKDGYRDNTESATVYQNTPINITLNKIHQAFWMQGWIQECGQPNIRIEGANIDVYYCGSQYTTQCVWDWVLTIWTDENGVFNYTQTKIPIGYYKFVVTAMDYQQWTDAQTWLGDEITMCLQLESPNYWIRGIIMNRTILDTGKEFKVSVIGSVEVWSQSTSTLVYQATTTSNGLFEVRLPRGTYVINAKSSDRRAKEHPLLLNKNYKVGEIEMIVDIYSGMTPRSRKETMEEFIDTLYTILPSIILLLIALMLFNAVQSVTRGERKGITILGGKRY